MTEIRVDVDLPHPRERVWKALTDPQIIREWFLPVELADPPPDGDPEDGAGAPALREFVLHPRDEPGFEEPITGELVEVDRGAKLVMRWRSPQIHTVVTVSLHPAEEGCRLTLVQRGFLGPQGTLRRRVLQRTYREMVGPALRGALDRLAEQERERERAEQARRQAGGAGQRNGRRNEARFFGYVPRQASAAWAGLVAASRNMSRLRSSSAPGLSSRRRRPPARGVAAPAGEPLRESPTAPLFRGGRGRRVGAGRRRRGRQGPGQVVAGRPLVAVGASAAILILLAALAVLVERVTTPGAPGTPYAAGERNPRDVLVPGGRQVRVSPGGDAFGPSPLPPDGGAVPPPVTLVAAYHTEGHVVGGYHAVVTINNLSSQPVDGWSVRIVLPPLGLVVRGVDGASVEEGANEKEIRFVPVPATRVVPAGQSIRYTFQVQGVGDPVECTINDQPCSGIPG